VQDVRNKYMQGLNVADERELAIHRRLSRLNYSRRCTEASAVKAYQDGDWICGQDAAKWARIPREMPLDLMLGIMGSC
jgi:hypothetical protein